ncbi:MAG TPA: deoxyribonuclease IV [Candidatus Paceibacterota bacterium]
MLFGAHVSMAGGIDKAPDRAAEIGCEVFQIFSRPPQGGNASDIDEAPAERFQANLKKYNQKEFYIHAPYIINLASTDGRIRGNSIRLIREDLQIGSLLGARYVMTHLGSAKELARETANKMVVENLKKVFDPVRSRARAFSASLEDRGAATSNGVDKDYKTQLLIEMSAGAGNIIGSTFEDLAYFTDKLKDCNVGICLDTAHMFASGYDLRGKEAVKATFDKFEKIVGFKHLKLIHLNDSKVDFGSRKDRHEHIGDGKIGLEGFRAIVSEKRLRDINMICETESDKVAEDIKILKGLRGR